jgi:signal transduction histidine kinase/ActR/RegA family two-component response regulator
MRRFIDPIMRAVDRHRTAFVALGLTMLVLASVIAGLYSEHLHQRQVIQAARVQARIVADSLSGALAFGDQATVSQITTAIRANPEIEALIVLDDKGIPVAHYGETIMLMNGQNEQRTDDGFTVRVPVEEKGVALGTIILKQRSEALALRLARYAGAALLLVAGLLMLTVMAFDTRALARSNRRLREVMDERERAEAALRQSQKMEALGRLTGGIAHDFNNMLAVIIGNLDLFMRRYPDADAKMLRFVTGSQEAAKRAAALTQRLLAFSRRQPLDPKATDVSRSITDLSDILRRTLGDAISIELRTPKLWRANVDTSQFETALINLVVNARDAMPDGGKLFIECANARLDQSHAENEDDVVPGEYVMVAVTDTGTGMSADVLAQVFEPFFTTKAVGLGTGLGLSQVHGFVKQSGGHVSLSSEAGRGTTVKLYLPRSSDVTEIPVSERIVRAEHGRRDKIVLVVDDETGVRDFVCEAVTELGYDVLSAENADQALDIFEEGMRIDILLTDVLMPGRSGRELADEVLARYGDMPILFMTGYAQDAIVHNGKLDLGTHLVKKPFTIDQIGAELERLESAAQ